MKHEFRPKLYAAYVLCPYYVAVRRQKLTDTRHPKLLTVIKIWYLTIDWQQIKSLIVEITLFAWFSQSFMLLICERFHSHC